MMSNRLDHTVPIFGSNSTRQKIYNESKPENISVFQARDVSGRDLGNESFCQIKPPRTLSISR